MSKFSIMPMVKQDIKSLKGFVKQAFGDELGEPWTERTSEEHCLEVFNKDFCFSVKKDGEVVGGVFAYPSIFEKGTEIFVDVIVVSPSERGRGLGRKLFNQVITKAKKNNFVGVRLMSNPKLKSYDWYHKMGLDESGWVELVKFF